MQYIAKKRYRMESKMQTKDDDSKQKSKNSAEYKQTVGT